MAGDWIKTEHTLPDKPEVIQMASILSIDQDAITGKLLRVWIWADANSIDGNALNVTYAFLDRITMASGFSAAMREVGWLSGEDGKLTLPNFERHNGITAKRRSETNRRVSEHRKRECNGKSVTDALPKALPEKRREEGENREEGDSEKKPSPLPLRAPLALGSGKVPKEKNTPESPMAIRIAELFNRRLSTGWSKQEIAAFKSLGEIIPEDMDAIDAYYANERAMPDGWHRKDLSTFLNNFRGELDRANAWIAGGRKKDPHAKNGAKPAPEPLKQYPLPPSFR